MPIQLHDRGATLTGHVCIEDAEALLAWLQTYDAPVDMAQCEHVHPAVLQILYCGGARITPLPMSPALRAWLSGEAASVDAFLSTDLKGPQHD